MSARDRWTDMYSDGSGFGFTGRVSILVMKIGATESVWCILCHAVGINDYLRLDARDADTAKVEALALVRARLAAMLADLDAGERP